MRTIQMLDLSLPFILTLIFIIAISVFNYLQEKKKRESRGIESQSLEDEGLFLDEDEQILWHSKANDSKVDNIEKPTIESPTIALNNEGIRSTFNDMYLQAEAKTRAQQEESAIAANGIDEISKSAIGAPLQENKKNKVSIKQRIKANPQDLVVFSEVFKRPNY